MDVRNHTSPAIRTEEPVKRETPDELAHVRGFVLLEPRQDFEKREQQKEEVEKEERRGGPEHHADALEQQGDGRGGSSEQRGEGEAEQFVFLDGAPLLTTLAGRPTEQRAFDQQALGAGWLAGGLDLVAEDGLVRMVFNGRLRLSQMSEREDRRGAASLLAGLAGAVDEKVDLQPYGPHHLVFDLGPRFVPMIDGLELLRGMTFERARAAMQRALAEGRERDFATMNAELAAAHAFMGDVAEVAPDLLFQELKLLAADLSTPAFVELFPDLVDTRGEVNAQSWARGFERLAAQGDVAGMRAISEFSAEQLRYLLSGPNGHVFGPNDAAELARDPARAREGAVRFLRVRVMGAAMREFEDTRAQQIERGLAQDVPRGLAFAGDPAYAAAFFAIARADRARFAERIGNVRHAEEDGVPRFDTALGAVTLDELHAFADEAASVPQGLYERLISEHPEVAAPADPFAAALHLALQKEGFEDGIFGAPPAAIARLLYGRPVSVNTVAADDPRALAGLWESGGALVAVCGGERRAAAAWGVPSLFGIQVRAQDLALATSEVGAERTVGLTNLANTLEAAGAAPGVVDALMALKSRANRPGPEDPGLKDAVLAYIGAHLELDPAGESAAAAIVLLEQDGRASFTGPGMVDALERIEPNPSVRG